MLKLLVKSTVRPKSLLIAAAAINAAHEVSLSGDVVITSGNDSRHKTGSAHYTDRALDFRTKHLSDLEKVRWKVALQRRLGPAYQVFLEELRNLHEHLHVEYDPQ
jgi:hypothetical protein